jgi:hypothetical protein
MSNARELQRVVRDLPPEELARFRTWFLKFDAAAWDRQIEEDVAAGRLDVFAEEALEEYRAGRTRPL